MRIDRPLALCLTVLCLFAPRAEATEEASGTPARAQATIVVQNAYFAKPGLEEEVYRTRLRASGVRARLGLVVGRVLRRADGPEGGPYVVWEAEYPSLEARERDVEAVSGSAEFDAVAEHMGTLLARFERSVWTVEVTAPAEAAPADRPVGARKR